MEFPNLKKRVDALEVSPSGRRLFSKDLKAEIAMASEQTKQTLQDFAIDLGLAPSVLLRWRRDVGLASRRPRKKSVRSMKRLPTVKPERTEPKRRRRSNSVPTQSKIGPALVPVAFACPHCGNIVSLKES